MSLLRALDESEKSSGHGWCTSGQFDLEGGVPGQGETNNIYRHLINQNNTGNVPEALLEEEVVNDLPVNPGPVAKQPHNHSNHQHQQMNPYTGQKQQPGQANNLQQQQQQQVLTQPYQQQQMKMVQASPKVTQHLHSILTQQKQNALLRLPLQQNAACSGLVQSGQQKHVVSQQQGMIGQQQQQRGQVVSMPSHMSQSMQQYVTEKINHAQDMPNEHELDLQLMEQQKLIEVNNEKLRQMGQLPIDQNNPGQTGYNNGGKFVVNNQSNVSVQFQNSVQTPFQNCRPGMVSVPAHNNNGGYNRFQNSPRPQQRPVSMPTHRPNILRQSVPNSRIVQQQQHPQLHQQEQQFRCPQATGVNQSPRPTSILAKMPSPVQVSSISTNQNQSLLTSPINSPRIDKSNVVLEGGGQFEEGQAYMIRDKQGNSRKMMWKNGTFVDLENEHSIQNPNIDSSQQKKGGRTNRGARAAGGKGRGTVPNQAPGAILGPPAVPSIQVRAPAPLAPTQGQGFRFVKGPGFRPEIRQQMQQAFPSIQPQHPSIQPQQIPQQIVVMTPQALRNLMPAQVTTQKPATSSSDTQPGVPQPSTETTTSSAASPDQKEAVTDPPNIPDDPTAQAICQFCGYVSSNKLQCERCKRKFTSATRYVSNNDPEAKRRKIEATEVSAADSGGVCIDKKMFYTQKLNEQNTVYLQVFNAQNNISVPVAGGRGVRVIRTIAGGKRGRGRGMRGRGGPMSTETVTISSDEEGGEDGSVTPGKLRPSSAPATQLTNQSPSPGQADCPESPLIPNIPISSRVEMKVGRVGKMEDKDGTSRQAHAKSLSPTELILSANKVRVGTFQGIPIEPILISKGGLSFYVEGLKSTNQFAIYPAEIQQCLANFAENNSLIFLLTSVECGVRVRQNLGMPNWTNLNICPPDPYFEPTSKDMCHQMVTIVMGKVDAETHAEFRKYMELFKSKGKQGDEDFYMELSREEADDVFSQTVTVHRMPPMIKHETVVNQKFSQWEDNRSPSPPKIGFEGPVVVNAMGKADPQTAKGGKRKATGVAPSDEPAPKNSRLATLITVAISQDPEVLQEIQSEIQALLSSPAKATQNPDDNNVNVQSQIDRMKCPKCGIEVDGKFCQDCGTKLTVKAKVVLCPGKDDDGNPCNVELSSEQKFCKNCGHSVDQAWFWSGKCGNCGAPCPEGQNLCATCITAHTSVYTKQQDEERREKERKAYSRPSTGRVTPNKTTEVASVKTECSLLHIKTEPEDDSGPDIANNSHSFYPSNSAVTNEDENVNCSLSVQSGNFFDGDKSEVSDDTSVNVKQENTSDSDSDSEITGVEEGQLVHPQDWGANVSMAMNFDPTGATGSQADMTGESRNGPPGKPKGPLEVTDVTKHSAKLAWKDPEDDGGVPIDGYRVEKMDIEKGRWEAVKSTKKPELEVPKLVEGHQFKFRVITESPNGDSEPLELGHSITAKNPFNCTAPQQMMGDNVCGFCHTGEESVPICGTLHKDVSDGKSICAHHKCMQYSANLVQYKDKADKFGGFEKSDVAKEIKRGSKLPCAICKNDKSKKYKNGASSGCALASCKKTFHYLCVEEDGRTVVKKYTVAARNKSYILYRVFCCQEHKLEYEETLSAEDIVDRNQSSDEDNDGKNDRDSMSSDSEDEPVSKEPRVSGSKDSDYESDKPNETPSSPMSATEVIAKTQEKLTELLRKKVKEDDKSICKTSSNGDEMTEDYNSSNDPVISPGSVDTEIFTKASMTGNDCTAPQQTMVDNVCGFCHTGEDSVPICGTLHKDVSDGKSICAHYKCMQYSAMLVQYKTDRFGGFKKSDVAKEIKRGSKLPCAICKNDKSKKYKNGASGGCALASCKKTFHYLCVAKDGQTKALAKRYRVAAGDEEVFLYRVFCSQKHKLKYKETLSGVCDIQWKGAIENN